MSKLFLTAVVSLILSGCATSIPSNFEYKSSVRGERGLEGTFGRNEVVTSLFDGGVVMDPALALEAALPDADVSVRKWGLRYFNKDWERYQVRLDANIQHGDIVTKCREVSSEGPIDAPSLNELLQNKGVELQRHLSVLVASCVAQAS